MHRQARRRPQRLRQVSRQRILCHQSCGHADTVFQDEAVRDRLLLRPFAYLLFLK